MKSSDNRKKGGGFIRILLILIFSGIFVFSAVKAAGILTEYKQGVDIYNEVRESYGIRRETSSQEPSKKDRERARAEAAAQEGSKEDVSAITEDENPDDEQTETGLGDNEDPENEDVKGEASDKTAGEGKETEADSPDGETKNAENEEEAEVPDGSEADPEDEADGEKENKPEDEADGEKENKPEDEADGEKENKPEDEADGEKENKPEDETDGETGKDSGDQPDDEKDSEEVKDDMKDQPGGDIDADQADAQPEPQKPAKKWYRPYVSDYSDHEHPEKLPFLHTTIDFLLIPPYIFDFNALIAMNQDVCGWIMIKDTYVDYPMVQGTDNVFYLRHAVSGELNNAGSVFVDYRHTAPFYEKNTLVYAHNQRNLRMFHQILSYKDKEYMEEHPYIDIYLPDGSMQIYRVYSCYVESGTRAYVIKFPDDQAFMNFVNYTQESSLYDSGVPIFPDSRILTLVTCTNEADETRVVLHAVLVEQTAAFEMSAE